MLQRRSIKNLLIEPFKQVKFGLYVLGLSLSFCFAIMYLFIHSFYEQYQQVMSIFGIIDPKAQWSLVINDVFIQNAFWVGLLVLIYIVSMLVLVFRLTHSYYGPLVAMDRFVKQLLNGQFSARISLRKRDEFQNFAAQLNELAKKLELSKES